jgi:glycosyltransferase involved in cell wall biosynthesis
MSGTLAIAAGSFRLTSETFIRDHVRLLAPQRTVLLSRDDEADMPCPTLTGIRRQGGASILLDRARALWGLVAEPGLYGADRRRVAAFLREHDARAVLAEYGPMGVQLMGACRMAEVPLYVHFHGYDATLPRRRWHVRHHYRRLFGAAAGIIAPSQFLADVLRELGCPPAKLHVSHNGVDPHRFPQTTREPGRVLAVGRLVAKKAPHLTIRAFAAAHARHPRARLDVIGDGDLRDRCEALVRELGLGDAVRLHGACPPEHVQRLLARASLFVQHSVTAEDHDVEGLPISILEAMAAELPVVSTRHSGIPEAVGEGRTALLVEEGDVAGMGRAIEALLGEPERAAAMGRAGRERLLAHFTHERVRRRLLGIMDLEDLLETPDAAPTTALPAGAVLS